MSRKTAEHPIPPALTPQQIHAARVAERMAARVRESRRLAAEWEATKDPRERADLDP
jgi:hypothetical protein